MPATKEQSYGIIPFRQSGDNVEVLLVLHRNGEFWGFPKGHGQPKENPLEVARRELYEETQLEVEQFMSLKPLSDRYTYMHAEKGEIDKHIDYFMASVSGDVNIQDEEILEARWVTIDEAFELLTYEGSRNVCKQALVLLLKSQLGG